MEFFHDDCILARVSFDAFFEKVVKIIWILEVKTKSILQTMGATLPDWSGIPDFFHFGNPDSRFFFCSPDQFPIFLFSWSVPDFFRVVSVQS